MDIREIDVEELDVLLELYRDLHKVDDPVAADVVQKTWLEIQDNPHMDMFGVFVKQELVSSCALTVIPNLTRGCRPYGLIENVVTRMDMRRNGYGKAMLAYALNHAWQLNCYKVMLMTGRKDEDTFIFYESAGFDRQAKQAFIAKPDN